MTVHGNRLEYSESNTYRDIQKSFGKKLNLNFTCKDFQIISWGQKNITFLIQERKLNKWFIYLLCINEDFLLNLRIRI